MSVFDVFNNGTVTLIRCNATRDGLGAPKAAYFNDDGTVNEANVIAADVPAQIEYHIPRGEREDMIAWEQPVVQNRLDIWLTGVLDYLNGVDGNANGLGVKFTSASMGNGFGRVRKVEIDGELGAAPTSPMLVVEVVDS